MALVRISAFNFAAFGRPVPDARIFVLGRPLATLEHLEDQVERVKQEILKRHEARTSGYTLPKNIKTTKEK